MQRTMKRNYLKEKIYEEAHCTHDSPLDDRLSEFLRLSPIYGKNIVLDALHISKGTYHNRIIIGQTPTYLKKRREQISREVQLIFDESRQCYGANKILSILQDRGYRTSKKYILSIMHDLGLESIRVHACIPALGRIGSDLCRSRSSFRQQKTWPCASQYYDECLRACV